MFYNLTPLITAVLSVMVIGEWPQAYHGAAFLLIVAGILVASRDRSERPGKVGAGATEIATVLADHRVVAAFSAQRALHHLDAAVLLRGTSRMPICAASAFHAIAASLFRPIETGVGFGDQGFDVDGVSCFAVRDGQADTHRIAG